MENIKRILIERAKKKYKDIRPCPPYSDFSKCFTEHDSKLIFWFNADDDSTRILSSKIPVEENA